MKLFHIFCTCLAFSTCLGSAGVTPALAQTGIIPPPNLTAPAPSRVIPEAPIGHRQPRASEVTPPQANGVQALDDENARQDAALDRKIKGICKGC